MHIFETPPPTTLWVWNSFKSLTFVGSLTMTRPSFPPVAIFLRPSEKCTQLVPIECEIYSSFGYIAGFLQSTFSYVSVGHKSYYFKYLSSPVTKILFVSDEVITLLVAGSTFLKVVWVWSSGIGTNRFSCLAVGNLQTWSKLLDKIALTQ